MAPRWVIKKVMISETETEYVLHVVPVKQVPVPAIRSSVNEGNRDVQKNNEVEAVTKYYGRGLEIEELKTMAADRLKRMENMHKSILGLEMTVKSLNEENHDHTEKIEKMKVERNQNLQEVIELKSALFMEKNEIEELQEIAEDRLERITELGKIGIQRNHWIAELEANLKKSSDRIDELTEETKKLRSQAEAASDESEKLRELREVIAEKTSTIVGLETEATWLKMELDTVKNDADYTISAMEDDFAQLELNYALKEAQVTELEMQLKSNEVSKDSMSVGSLHEISALRRKVEERDQEINEFLGMIAHKTTQIIDLQLERNEMERLIENLTEIVEKAKRESKTKEVALMENIEHRVHTEEESGATTARVRELELTLEIISTRLAEMEHDKAELEKILAEFSGSDDEFEDLPTADEFTRAGVVIASAVLCTYAMTVSYVVEFDPIDFAFGWMFE